MPVYVFLFLYYRNRFRQFLIKLSPEIHEEKAADIMDDISDVGVRHMAGITLLVVSIIILNSVALLVMGIKYALVLGIISGLFAFIPYLGVWIGAFLAILVTLFINSPQMALKVFLTYVVVIFIEHNFLAPKILGNKHRLNPYTVIFGVIAGEVMWGVIGMIVAVPFLAMFRILCKHVERLHPYEYLLSQEDSESGFSWKKVKNVFTRG
jgi:predicted PurR-regulated permease PerM